MSRIKDCYCVTCDKALHHLGLARHRALHRDRRENCTICHSDGAVFNYTFARKQEEQTDGETEGKE